MKANTVTATVTPKKRSTTTVLIVVYTLLTLFSLVMGIYDIALGKTLFGILFLIAALIFLVLMLIKGNTVYGTNLKIKDDTLYLKRWENGFLPYTPDGASFFSDLKPAKTKIVSVPVDSISQVFIGTKDFIKRNITDSGKRFLKAIYPYERSSKKSKRSAISGLDMFYIETTDGDCAFMSIQDYSVKNVVEIINEIYNANPQVEIKVSNREYKKYIMKLQNI